MKPYQIMVTCQGKGPFRAAGSPLIRATRPMIRWSCHDHPFPCFRTARLRYIARGRGTDTTATHRHADSQAEKREGDPAAGIRMGSCDRPACHRPSNPFLPHDPTRIGSTDTAAQLRHKPLIPDLLRCQLGVPVRAPTPGPSSFNGDSSPSLTTFPVRTFGVGHARSFVRLLLGEPGD